MRLPVLFASRLKIYRIHFNGLSTFPDIDVDYYCNKNNMPEISKNVDIRKGIGDINKVINIYELFNNKDFSNEKYSLIKEELYSELKKLPNKTHPKVQNYEDPVVIKEINPRKKFNKLPPLEFSEICRLLNLMRTDKLGHTCGHKSYYFLESLAELEEALVKYTVKCLIEEGFRLVSVPDILHSSVLEGCGMMVNNNRTQIYSLDPVHHGPDLCLSGTAEMSLAGLLKNTIHDKTDLPVKLAAVSRCFRAETSNLLEERGIYRVHQFTKVEMFAVTTPEQSEKTLDYITEIQEKIFTPLDIHMRVLDMPPPELGAPAYRKYDIEAWMPGRNNYGEISSCSNCTDYQSRRLNIKYVEDDKSTNYVHTLNGTACALPRMLITLLETHQDPKGKVNIPLILQPYLNGKQFITKNTKVPELKLNKMKK